MPESLKCRKCQEEVRTYNEPCPKCGDKEPWLDYLEEMENSDKRGQDSIALWGCLMLILVPIALIGGFLAWPLVLGIVVVSIFVPRLFPNLMKWMEKKFNK
jgi:hypothetical protein